MDDLEKIQHEILTRLLAVPASTPYYGLLMETGWLTMEARMGYKRLMIFHNIVNSEESRIMRKILEEQKKEERGGTWYDHTQQQIKKYEIEIPASRTRKSEWKKHVKQKIRKRTEEDIRDKCKKMKKTKIIKDDEYTLKEYIKELKHEDAKDIMKVRLYMVNVPENYKNLWKNSNCPLCNHEESSQEHFVECPHVTAIANVWEVSKEDLYSKDLQKMKRIAKYMKKVEELLEPKWKY